MEEWGSPIGGTIEALGNQELKGKERRAVIFTKKSGELKIHLKGKTEQSIFRGWLICWLFKVRSESPMSWPVFIIVSCLKVTIFTLPKLHGTCLRVIFFNNLYWTRPLKCRFCLSPPTSPQILKCIEIGLLWHQAFHTVSGMEQLICSQGIHL